MHISHRYRCLIKISGMTKPHHPIVFLHESLWKKYKISETTTSPDVCQNKFIMTISFFFKDQRIHCTSLLLLYVEEHNARSAKYSTSQLNKPCCDVSATCTLIAAVVQWLRPTKPPTMLSLWIIQRRAPPHAPSKIHVLRTAKTFWTEQLVFFRLISHLYVAHRETIRLLTWE